MRVLDSLDLRQNVRINSEARSRGIVISFFVNILVPDQIRRCTDVLSLVKCLDNRDIDSTQICFGLCDAHEMHHGPWGHALDTEVEGVLMSLCGHCLLVELHKRCWQQRHVHCSVCDAGAAPREHI